MIRTIVKLGDPVLEKPAEQVTDFDSRLRELVDDMFDSMYAAKGIGLAAPQIGVSKRIVVVDVSFQNDSDANIVLLNPVIVSTEGKQIMEEGCLSIPGICEKVMRPSAVSVRAQDVHGNWFERSAQELLARVLLHEIDHLDGRLFFSRMSALKRELIKRRIRRMVEAGKW